MVVTLALEPFRGAGCSSDTAQRLLEMAVQPPEVFLSHATADKEHVDLVRGQLEALGLRVYLAEHDPHPGRPLAEKVTEAMRRVVLVVVLITSTSTDSHY